MVISLLLATLLPQGYWGYYFQLLLTGLGAAIFLLLNQPLLDWRLGLVASFWLGLGILAGVAGGANDAIAAASQAIVIDTVFVTGALFALVLGTAQQNERGKRLLVYLLFLTSAVLLLTTPLLQNSAGYRPELWRLLGRAPQLLGSSEALEISLLCLIALWLWQHTPTKFAQIVWSILLASHVLFSLWLSARSTALAGGLLVIAAVWQWQKLRLAFIWPVLLTIVTTIVFWAWGPTTTFRYAIGQATVMAALSQPWGYGRGGFDRALEAQAQPLLEATVYNAGSLFGAPDQFFSGVLIERGFLPFLALLVGLVWYLWHLRQQQQQQVLAALISLLLLMFSDLSYNPIAWFLLATVLTKSFLRQNNQTKDITHKQFAPTWSVYGLAILTMLGCVPVLHVVMSQQRLVNAVEALYMGNLVEAERQLLEYAGRSQNHIEGWLALGRIREQAGQYAAAADAFRKASELNPKLRRAAELRTLAAFKAGDFKAAASATNAWVDLPGKPAAITYYAGAYALAKVKENYRALKVASKGLAQYPSDIELQRLVARLKMVEGNFVAAEMDWRNIIKHPAATVQDAIYLEVALENLGRNDDIIALRQAYPAITLTTITAGTLLKQRAP